MAWNGSNQSSQSTNQSISRKVEKSKNLTHGLFAGLIIVALGGVAVWWFAGRGLSPSAPQETGRKSARIAAVVPQVVTNKVVAEVVPMVTNRFGMVVPKLKKKTYVDERGVRRYMNGQRCFEGRPMRPKRPSRPPSSIFKHGSEREIEALLTLEAGGHLFGHRDYGKRFVEDLKKSCEEPIIVSEDDSESIKALKKAMNETKIDLMNRLKNGEDISKVMQEAHEESMRLAAYKDDVEKMVRENVREHAGELSDQDCRDLVEAANKLLASKGIAPMKGGTLTRMNLKLKAKARQSENLSKGENK